MTRDEVTALITDEVQRATAKFPTWPTDPLHALAVLGEEFGELTKEVLQLVYEPHKTSRDKVREEAIQTAAMAVRFLMSLDSYAYVRSAQHEQSALADSAPQEEDGAVRDQFRRFVVAVFSERVRAQADAAVVADQEYDEHDVLRAVTAWADETRALRTKNTAPPAREERSALIERRARTFASFDFTPCDEDVMYHQRKLIEALDSTATPASAPEEFHPGNCIVCGRDLSTTTWSEVIPAQRRCRPACKSAPGGDGA